jgi:hypothetical protein
MEGEEWGWNRVSVHSPGWPELVIFLSQPFERCDNRHRPLYQDSNFSWNHCNIWQYLIPDIFLFIPMIQVILAFSSSLFLKVPPSGPSFSQSTHLLSNLIHVNHFNFSLYSNDNRIFLTNSFLSGVPVCNHLIMSEDPKIHYVQPKLIVLHLLPHLHYSSSLFALTFVLLPKPEISQLVLMSFFPSPSPSCLLKHNEFYLFYLINDPFRIISFHAISMQ